MPFTSDGEKCHNGFNQPRPKCRVHPPPEAVLSLIRRASSCLQTKTRSAPWWQPRSRIHISPLAANYTVSSHDFSLQLQDSMPRYGLKKIINNGGGENSCGFVSCERRQKVTVSSQQDQINADLMEIDVSGLIKMQLSWHFNQCQWWNQDFDVISLSAWRTP